MVDQALLDTQCDSCFEAAASGRILNGVCESPAVVHCVDCVKNLCASCCSRPSKLHYAHDDDGKQVKGSHKNVVDLATHLRRTFRRGVRFCDQHADEPVTKFCFDCRTALCSYCSVDRTHRIHRCVPIDKAASEFSHQLERDVDMVADRYRQCVDEADRVERERCQFVESIEKTAVTIRQTEEQIKRLITEHAEELLRDLEAIKTETMQKVDAIQSDINRFLAVADSFLQYARTLRDRGTAVDVTLAGDDLLVRAAKLQKMSFSETDGQLYKTHDVSFTPWFDVQDLLTNRDANIVGRISTVSPDASVSSRYSVTSSAVRTMLEDARAILGVAVISGHVFVARAESPELEIYSAVTLSLKDRLPVAGLRAPTDLVAYESAGCLFVADWSECRIHRVAVQTGRQIGRCKGPDTGNSEATLTTTSKTNGEESGWWTSERPWSLALVERRRQCTVLVTCDQASKLYEYTEFGSIVRQVCLASDLCNPRHAVLLTTGQFVVSLKDSICLTGVDGRRILPHKTSSSTGAGRVNVSGRLAVDDCGCLLVLDVDGRRVLQFDAGADLKLVRELVSCDARLRYPARLCVDQRLGRLYVADNELSQRTRLQTKFWGKTGRIVIYDTRPS